MAKESKSLAFNKAIISIDEETGDFIVEEIIKNDSKVYNLSNRLKEYCGIEGLTIKISKDSELVSEE